MRKLGQRKLSWQPAQPMQGGILAEGPQGVDIYPIHAWRHMNDIQRVAALRELSEEYSNDPRLRWKAAEIVQAAHAQARDYPAQAAALLAWVQDNIYYTHEVQEQLQSPWRTLQVRTGDCDDSALLLAALAKSIGIKYRYVLAGKGKKGMVRWIEGQPFIKASYFHIYLQLGWLNRWVSAEPTMKAPLGYDLVVHGVNVDDHGRATVPKQAQLSVYSATQILPETKPMQPTSSNFYGGIAPAGTYGSADLADYQPVVPKEEEEKLFSKTFMKNLGLRTFEAVITAITIYAVMRMVEK